jgi:hypothetical protein
VEMRLFRCALKGVPVWRPCESGEVGGVTAGSPVSPVWGGGGN